MFLRHVCPQYRCVCLAMCLAGFASFIRADDAPAPGQPEATKYALKYKFKPGEVVRSQIWHRGNLETTIEGTTQTAETVSGTIKIWRITGVDPQGKSALNTRSKASTCGKKSAAIRKSRTTAKPIKSPRWAMKWLPTRWEKH